ncbi:c6 zinc finger domain containing protein [Rutstroemia sp. NJR-2017a WRK4]|nr:c6 zinc finger domain containing protein [Rutstroemia sp. NJR-2017a WRK4]
MASPQANRSPSPTSPTTTDPFAAQRTENHDFTNQNTTRSPITIPSPTTTNNDSSQPQQHSTSPSQDRRLSSDEWDASKTPPSRFQKRKGSIYATPSSRDGHVDKHIDRDAVFHATHAEKGWGSVFGKGGAAAGGRRGSKGE